MKNSFLLPLIGIIILFNINFIFLLGQGPSWNYAKTGSEANNQDMKIDSLGNVYHVLYFYTATFEYQDKTVQGMTGSESANLVLLKTEPTGKPLWMHSIMGTSVGASIGFNDMAISQRGELVVSFTVSNTSKFIIDKYSSVTNPLDNNVFIAKFSKTGLLIWVKQVYSNGSSTPTVNIGDLIIDENGTVYIAGSFTGANFYIDDLNITGLGDNAMMFVSKIEPRGEVAWAQGCVRGTGFDGNIYANKISVSKLGMVYIAGTYSGYQNFYFGSDSTSGDMSINTFLAGYSPTGTALWGRFITGAISEYPEKIIVADNTDVFLFGFSNSNPMNIMGHSEDNSGSNSDMYILHVTNSGNYLNSATLSTQIPNLPFGKSSFGVDKDNNVILSTEFYSTTLFTDAAIIINPDPGSSDLAFAKLDRTTLKPVWRVHGTGSGQNNLDASYIDPSGNICMAGTMYNNLAVAGNLITGSSLYGAPYLLKIKMDGSVDYTFQKTNSSNNQMVVGKTALDIYGNVYIIGTFSGPDNLLGSQPLQRPLNTGIFLAKYSYTKNICGIVYDPLGEIINAGYVKIFGYTYFQRSPINDSIPINLDGSYCFNDLPYGRYILCAFPQNDYEPAFVPTYFPSEINWEFADKIIVNIEIAPAGYDIVLVDRTLFTGDNGLVGKVQQADSNNIYKSAKEVSWKPSQRATVVLASKRKIKSTDDFYAETETDDDGNFSFDNVQDGTYYLWVEIPGLPSEEYIAVVSGGSFTTSLNFLADEENVYKTGNPASNPKFETDNNEDWAFPNPAINEIMIDIAESNTKSEIRIFDLQGILIYKSESTSGINRINVSDLVAGTYFLQLTTINSTRLKKISILH